MARTGVKDLGREASSFTYLLVLGLSLPPHYLWDGVSLQHSLLAGSRSQTTSHQPLLQCQWPLKAGRELSMGRGVTKTTSQTCTRAGPRHATAPTARWPLIYEPGARWVGWWLLFNE